MCPLVVLMPSTNWSWNSTLSHKYRYFTGSPQKMKHERFYRGVLQHSACSFYRPTFLGRLGPLIAALTFWTITQSTRSSFQLKYFTGITFDCLVTCETPLGSPFARRAGMLLSVVLVLAHALLILVNPLHTIPSGFLSVYGADWMKAILKQRPLQPDLLSIQEINTLSHSFRLCSLPLDPWPRINNGVRVTFHCLVLTKIVYNGIYHL